MTVGHSERRQVDDHVVDGHDVNVYHAVDIAAMLVAVTGTGAQFTLDIVDKFEHTLRFLLALDGEGTIEEDMIVVVHYIPKAWTLSIRYIYPDGRDFSVTTMALATEELYFAHKRAEGHPCPPGLA